MSNKQAVIVIGCIVTAFVLFIIAQPWLFFALMKWWALADRTINGAK